MDSLLMLEEVGCVLCGPEASDPVLSGRDFIHQLPGRFSVVQCRECGLLYTNPRPSSECMILYYPEDYGPHRSAGEKEGHRSNSYDDHKGLRRRVSSLIGRLLDSNSTALPYFESPGRILEIGCASGAFLSSMKRKGWDTLGIEFASKPVNYARETLGLNVIQGTAEKMEFPEESFDLVVAWMVVEHLHDPLEALKRIAKVLKKGGIFAFSVPNAGSWELRLFKKYWYGLHLPNHLYHFTITSIRLLLQKAGLQIERIIFQRCMRNIVASLGFILRESWGETVISNAFIRYPEKGRWYTQMLLMPLGALEAVLKQSGRITIWARKD